MRWLDHSRVCYNRVSRTVRVIGDTSVVSTNCKSTTAWALELSELEELQSEVRRLRFGPVASSIYIYSTFNKVAQT